MTTPPTNEATTWVIGHRNPDTDAICSAIGYADYLQRTRLPGAQAACCGEINERTVWALERAGVPAPRLLMNVRPTAASICRRDPVTATADESFLTVYERLTAARFRSLPVVDQDHQVVGVPSLADLLQLLLPIGSGAITGIGARGIRASLKDIANALGGTIEDHGTDVSSERDLIMVVGASTAETVKDRMSVFPADQLLVILGDRPKLQRTAVAGGVSALVITGGFRLDIETAAAAKAAGTVIIRCDYDTATTTQLVRCARRIGSVLRDDFLVFRSQAKVSEVLAAVEEVDQELFLVTDEDTGELIGVFSKSDLIDPPVAQLVLVDHNEFSQAVEGIEDVDILEVVDHHRLGGNLATREPIRYVNDTVGSTCTIVARFYRQDGIIPNVGIASCLVAGIIADTLNLTSPTTTDVDREILVWLAGIASIDIEAYTRDFFAAGSMLRSLSTSDAIRADRKEFNENGWRFSISQIEELGLDGFWPLEDELQASLETLVKESDVEFACLMVTDITRHYSVLVTAGAPEVISAIEYYELGRNLYEMRGVVSRKKQLLPFLCRIFGRLSR